MMKALFSSVLLFCALLQSSGLLAAEDQWQGVERIVAVGDVHGDYEHFVDVLQDAGIINRRGNWIADDTHLVQLGDVPDRGPATDEIIALLKKLERQAERDGGRVHVLIGNHEAMNVLGDLRYVHPGEYEALRASSSRDLRERLYEREVEVRKRANPDFEPDRAFREDWYQRVPLGYVEHRLAWNAEGDFGAWVAQHNTLIKINRTLFVHGGIGPETLGQSIREINEQVRAELMGASDEPATLLNYETGPLWYRGLAQNDEELELAHVDAVLGFYDVDRIVVGHTPSLGTIIPRFCGKVIAIDTGISEYYGGYLASLLIENDKLTVVHRGESFDVPTGEEPVLPYFRAIAEIEPESETLKNLILELESR